MPSSITSAPACGSALRIASEVSLSGSPAVRNVTRAARPWPFKLAKRVSMRVVMNGQAGWALSLECSLRRSLAALLASGGEPDVHGAEHQDHDRADELHPFLLFQRGPGPEQPHLDEPENERPRYDDQDPADELLPVDHAPLPSGSVIIAVPGSQPRWRGPCRRGPTGCPPSSHPSASWARGP